MMLKKARFTGLLVAFFMLLSLALAACGDSPTSTSAPATTTAAATTVAATTAAPATTAAVATTAAATTVAATTAAPTTAASTTRAATTAASTTAATSGGSFTLPNVEGATELNLPSSVTQGLTQQFPQIKNPTVKVYASADAPKTVADKVDVALLGAGYKFGLPGQAGPMQQSGQYLGLYTGKTGALDALTIVIDIAGTAGGTASLPGVSTADAKILQDTLKDKKSMLVVVAAPDLLNALVSIGTSTTPGAATTTRAAGTTAATTTRAAGTTAAATTVVGGSTTGAGTDLVGTLMAVGDMDVRVTKVERFDELKGFDKTLTPKRQGDVFLVLTIEIANLGKRPVFPPTLDLTDGTGSRYKSQTDPIGPLIATYKYEVASLINPSFAGSNFKAYEVPKDATGFKVVAGEFEAKSTRQPSAASFEAQGGKGPDSGAGQELAGKTLTKNTTTEKYELKVTKIERLSALKDGTKDFVTPGSYIIVQADITNQGDKDLFGGTFYLKDSDGRTYVSSSDFDLVLAVSAKYKPTTGAIKPNSTAQKVYVYEVVKEAKGFELTDNAF
jgi:hypothetical protein